jgi:hypothetical protein
MPDFSVVGRRKALTPANLNGPQFWKARKLLTEARFHPQIEVKFGPYHVDLLLRTYPHESGGRLRNQSVEFVCSEGWLGQFPVGATILSERIWIYVQLKTRQRNVLP